MIRIRSAAGKLVLQIGGQFRGLEAESRGLRLGMFRSDPLARLTHPAPSGPREKLSQLAMTVEIAVSARANCCLLN
jgi:hypothetical protein